jgi:hypothetical protein
MASGKYTQQTAEQRHELVRQIATALGPDWTYRNPSLDGTLSHWAKIKNDDGYSISVTSQWPTYALHISGEFPKDHHLGYNVSRPSINVSPAKTPEQIAKDIRRRLMPEYLPLWKQAKEQEQARNTFEAEQARLSDELYLLFPAGIARRGNGYDAKNKTISFHLENGYGDIDASNDSCSMKLRSIPSKLAKAIVGLIAKEGL